MIDSIEITIYAGRGGKGEIAFRREKFVPRGGPAGGDGGRGADVLLIGDAALSTLDAYRYKRTHKAEAGGRGGGSKKHGRDGSALELRVPVGTEVWLEGWERGAEGHRRLLGDLAKDGQRIIVGGGGRGGRGNARFVTPQQREPVLAEEGEDGQARLLRLELKLLADVGIVGLPNAGKSTLLSAISNARPKVADYPFTTLEPVLGVVGNDMRTLVAVDIPGLIEGAHEGVGLGHEFLKHVERTRILVHIVDGSEPDAAGRWRTVTTELREFDERLGVMPQIVVLNKTDIPEVEERRGQLEHELRAALPEGTPIYFVSAAGRTGLGELVEGMFRGLQAGRQESVAGRSTPSEDEPAPVLRPVARSKEKELAVRDEGGFRITHDRAVRLALGSDLSNWKARLQMRDQLKRMGVTRRLEQLGVAAGDRVAVGEWEFVWE